jgi:peptidyl-dipeptidase Dcp
MSTKPLALMIAASFSISAYAAAEQSAMPDTTAPVAASAAAAPAKAADAMANPFYAPSSLYLHAPAFDKIKDSDYLPAFNEGMRQQLAEIDVIANNKAAPSFDNTIVEMERSGQLLSRVAATFFNLTGANTNDTLEGIQRELSPKLAAHNDAIVLNGGLFDRVKALYDKRDSLGLDAESKRVLERYHTDFVRAGAQLNEADKIKLKAINAELATLSTTFSQNLLKETNASAVLVDKLSDLDGMSEAAITAAAKNAKDAAAEAIKAGDAAKAKSLEGKYLVALVNTTGQPPLASLKNRDLRRRLFEASVNRASHGGEFDNRGVIIKLAKLRAERAALLGYPNHATYVLEDETARTTQAVNKLLSDLAPAAVANAQVEAADMQKIIDAEKGGFQLAAYDWAYYTEKVRAERYNFDESQLKPYLQMDNVLQNGVFYAANQLYGLTFKERKDLPVYDPDVRVFEVFDKDGKTLALFYADYYARSNKRGGAWMNEYVSQSGLMGTQSVVANHLNIPKPAAGQPTLLTWDEVTTAFHEFGHALHGMFSNVKYPRFSGTNVPRDFVEYPSQVNEMWADWPSILSNYAKHYQTGAPMPKELLDKVLASSKFNQGFATTEYLAAALLDQRWHQLAANEIPSDALAFEAAALKSEGVDYAVVPPRYRSTYFSHIWGGGYSAGYYAYLWSEVLDAGSVEWFKTHGGLTRANGDHFRDTLLSRGGSSDAVGLYRTFTGAEPDVGPLLKRRGLDKGVKQ